MMRFMTYLRKILDLGYSTYTSYIGVTPHLCSSLRLIPPRQPLSLMTDLHFHPASIVRRRAIFGEISTLCFLQTLALY